MNKTKKKLLKLKALAELCNKQEKEKAKSKSTYEYNYKSFREFLFDEITDDSMPNIAICVSEVNCKGMTQQSASWTSIPYDVVFDPWTYVKDMTNGYHHNFSEISRLVRSVYKVGFDGLEFDRYKRTIDSIDYCNFKQIKHQ